MPPYRNLRSHARIRRNLLSTLLLFASLGQADLKVTEAEAKRAAIEKPPPVLSPVARQLKLSGTVELGVEIDETGTVTEVRVDKGSPVLAAGAVKSVKKWKFEPFTKDGKAVKASTTLVFEFKQ